MLSITWKPRHKKTSRRKVKRQSNLYKFVYPLYAVGCLAFFVFLLTGYLYMDQFLHEAQKWSLTITQRLGFHLKDVVVVGRNRTAKEDILSSVGLSRGDPLYQLDPHMTKAVLEESPWIEMAFVQRRPPHTVYVHLVESEPVALWQYQGKHQLINTKGTVIEGQDPRDFSDMIKVIGKDAPSDAPRIIQALSVYPHLRDKVSSLTHQHGRRWDMRLFNKMDVKLPEEHLEKALAKLQELEEEHDFSRGEIMMIDMRFPDKLVLRLTPEATKRHKALGREA